MHVDLRDPIKIMTFGNARDFIILVDDFMGKIWIYFLEEKSKTFLRFIEFKVIVERQSRYKLKNLHLNNGENSSQMILEISIISLE